MKNKLNIIEITTYLINFINNDNKINTVFYLLDSNSYINNNFNNDDFVHENQIEWYKEQLTEMNRTAALIQKKESEQRNKEMELIRAEAEKARAIADNAYMKEMNLSADQFIQLKYIEMINSKSGANIDVMVGPATSMWNIRRQ